MEESSLSELAESRNEYKRTLSGGLQSPRTEVPKEAIFKESIRKWQIHMNWDISSQVHGQLVLAPESDVLLTTL